jgi:hypothetical protein
MGLDLTGNKLYSTSIGTKGEVIKQIQTDGLVFHVDAGNKNSYTGTGTTWTDLSGNSNTGTLTNGPTYNSGNGGYILFDGINDYADIADSNSLDITPAVTIDTWVNFPTFTSYGGIIAKRSEATARGNYYLRVGDSTGQFQLGTFPNGVGHNIWVTSKTDFATNTWYHLVGTISSSTHKIYVNGVEYAGSFGWGGGTTMVADTLNLRIGMGYDSAGEPGNVKVSCVRIYNRALSLTEINQNYNAQKSRFGL